jgi:steroid delta-isomerase-like uncharacterized protein
MSKATKAVVGRWNQEIFNAGNEAAVDEIVAPDVVHHSPQGEMRGRDVIKQACRRWHSAFGNLRFTVTDLVAEGDKVEEHWTFSGTHKGEWKNVPATGKPVTFTGVTTLRVAGDRVVETWVHPDDYSFLEQVGEAPASAAARAFIALWSRIWNEGDLAAVDEAVSPDYVSHTAPGGDARGREPVRESYRRYRAAFPDMHFTLISLVAEGDKVVNHWSLRGTHRGEWYGVAATGKAITYTGVNVFRLVDGKAVESWGYWELGAFLRQTGRQIA